MMRWKEVRKAYPEKWVVFEAIDAHSDSNYRIVEDIAVIDCFNDSLEVFRRHNELHKQEPKRELYFFHTSREKLDIREKNSPAPRKI